MSTLYPQLRITDPQFKYVSSAKTDIRETFKRVKATQKQELDKPLVGFTLIPESFVLSVEWMD